METIKVIIAGSRKYDDYATLVEKCDKILSKKLENSNTQVVIVSGCAKGADSLGERYAVEKGLQVEKYPADWNRYGNSAGYRRNAQMAAIADALIAFPKLGEANKGTMNMIECARKRGLLIRIIGE